jgi:DNA polymerase-1
MPKKTAPKPEARVLLLDTYSLFFRAFHALPSMNTRAGEPTSALYGFSVLLLKLLREQRGAALSFALDAPQATFRHESFEGYKAGRPETPSALSEQFGRLRELLALLGAPVFRCPGFEADDVLATLAKRARAEGVATWVVSGDRDFMQLAHGSVKLHFVGQRGKDAVTYGEAEVLARFGVAPSAYPSYAALVGDPSDNLPSVPGIGPATAAKLLAGRRDCSELLAHAEAGTPSRAEAIVLAHRAQILETEQLARLREDAPIDERQAPWAAPSSEQLRALLPLFEALEFKSLSARVEALLV